MPKEDFIEGAGIILESLRNTMCHIEIQDSHVVLAHLGVKLRKHTIRIVQSTR